MRIILICDKTCPRCMPMGKKEITNEISSWEKAIARLIFSSGDRPKGRLN